VFSRVVRRLLKSVPPMRTLLLPALLLAACAPSLPAPVVDAGSDEVPDAGAPTPTDAGTACDGVQGCQLTWSESAEYPAPVDHHSTFIASSAAGDFLYVAGGVKNHGSTLDDVYAQVRRARIGADGSLGAWTDCSPLPRPIGFQGLGQKGDHVYLMAGVSKDAAGPFAHDVTLVGTVQPDGDITWVQSPQKLGAAFIHATGAVIGDTLFLIGGTGGSHGPGTTVKQSKLGADGSLGPWSDALPLPGARSHHVAIVRDGSIFILGGFDGIQEPIRDVLRSAHAADGALTSWSRAGEIESSPWTAGGFAFGQQLFLVGGGEGGSGVERYVDRVRHAQLYENGTLAGFVDAAPLPVARSHVHQAPQLNGYVYSVGGRTMPDLTSMGRVFVGGLTAGNQ
jgi:hypothetical protein